MKDRSVGVVKLMVLICEAVRMMSIRIEQTDETDRATAHSK